MFKQTGLCCSQKAYIIGPKTASSKKMNSENGLEENLRKSTVTWCPAAFSCLANLNTSGHALVLLPAQIAEPTIDCPTQRRTPESMTGIFYLCLPGSQTAQLFVE